MTDEPSLELLVRARQLQNGYAVAIDTRDWELFGLIFAVDVIAVYPHTTFQGRESWTAEFAAAHSRFGWTRHEMTNHVAGVDERGPWAACYGFIEWVSNDAPQLMNTTRALYRDRLRVEDGRLVIARRELRILSRRTAHPFDAGDVLVEPLEDLAAPLPAVPPAP